MSKNLNLQRALSLNLVPDIFLGLVDKNGNCHVNQYAACVPGHMRTLVGRLFIKHFTFRLTFICLL